MQSFSNGKKYNLDQGWAKEKIYNLDKWWANSGSRAKCGPP